MKEISVNQLLVDADTYSGLKSTVYEVLALLQDASFNHKETVSDKLIDLMKELAELEVGCLDAIGKQKRPQK